MTDEELGRDFRRFAQTVTDWSQTEWRDDGERRLGLMLMGLKEAARMAFESNAETFTTSLEGFHVKGVQAGDWSITVQRNAPPPPGERRRGMMDVHLERSKRRSNSPRQDRALSLRKAGLTLAEIAARDGSSVRTVRHLLRRAKIKADNRLSRKLRHLASRYQKDDEV
ncbi:MULTISPECIES: helix-turn-helix transcriptional regulator [unclassified Brevundimonas]|uniref:helix-turn-helix transcriptional regulator n=1 Tax=unclassified Brevundimonas TaxID=2622653 RepID=UPI001076383A|nr:MULTISPECIES: helix-turn-helix transcriptional regulator [unclassified Brevundimonas]QBX38633.1 helix-turn-helix transcriptional regulator [Brevundimonas sp. MF30-B]